MDVMTRSSRCFSVFAVLVISTSLTKPLDARVWSDVTGKYRVEADLISVEADTVRLKKPNGEIISVALNRLSRVDQAFLAKIGKRPKDDHSASPNKTSIAPPSRYGDVVESRVIMGLKITGVQGTISGLTGAIPVPAEWPEQELEIVATEKTPQVRKVSYREHDGGSRQMVINVSRLRAGETAVAQVTFLVRRRPILVPEDKDAFVVPDRPKRDIKEYLRSTPGIEVRNQRIQQIAKELSEGEPTGWQLARKTFDWIRENLEYEAGGLKGALWAAQFGKGDCEEYTSLFIALCRANGIPARAVWVPGHCYPEFYLEDRSGKGHWFPCDAVAGNLFGEMPVIKPILQKGDSFRVPELPGPQRYLSQTLVGNIGRGAAQPQLEMILRFE